MAESIIKVKDLSKSFGKIKAVDNISFEVKRGEIFGFLGPNGAGKTTTINIICTLLNKSRGSVTLCGKDVEKQRNAIRNCIGLVFQDPTLDDRLTAHENLYFHALLYNMPRKLIKERIDGVLKMVNLANRKNDLVRTFSGGMRRRLEIARGLLHYPQVLFLDEPTLGLDPQTRNRIWDYIIELKKSTDITIFLTTHYMDETEICNRIAIIDYGKIIALDTPDNLKKSIGGDIITVSSADDGKLKAFITDTLHKEIEYGSQGQMKFEVEDSSSFVPEFIKKSPVEILSISSRKPTLNDVFLHLTGREIREETVSSKDEFRLSARNRMRH
ncbi:MAG: ATP-binding cassette domain-containing protein [Actinomycetia bacterium]|nr:ATP-binding cassette domain-containing protein [Actinomycetes bacterium]